jgi:predicted RecB family nuclease
VKPFYPAPRPTVGHHFGELLSCPQRAWLRYYGNPQDQVKDPAYLRALQQEGLEHEQAIYDQCFPDAMRIPESGKPEERCRLTIEAMRSGVPVILQGYLFTGDGIGILDILERVDSDGGTGYIYRVGEIKRSATLKTEHVMQASWYTELLERLTGQHIQQACFFLGDGQRNIIELGMLQDEYERTKAELNILRQSTVDPGPHLSKLCPSCHWRSVCMPELIASQHISLVPGISRQQASVLQAEGITSWPQLKNAPDSVLEDIGMGSYEIGQVRAAIRSLEIGAPPLHHPLRPDIFENLQIVVVEFQDLAEQRREGTQPVPSAIHYDAQDGHIDRIEVSNVDGVPAADFSQLLIGKKLAFYGSTDLKVFMHIARQAGHKSLNSLDLFSVVETFLHCPVPGLELDALYSYLLDEPREHLTGAGRVAAIREVVNWISRSI